jgi:DNA-binding HxlR family transcriptional regulator
MNGSFNSDYATRQLLERLGDKWTVPAVSALTAGPKRFGELRRALHGVSQKVLTELVRSLERDGLFSRHVLGTVPLRVEYRLTPLGRSLAGLLEEIRTWAEAHMKDVTALRAAYDARGHERTDSDAGETT